MAKSTSVPRRPVRFPNVPTVYPALTFDNRFVRELPGDPDTRNMRRQVLGAAWSPVDPTPVAAPALLAHAPQVAELVGFSAAEVASPDFAQVFGGNALIPGMHPYAACYGGHQFGHWAGQLGDGRAIALGEVINPRGERWELQLKGAGPTPYSRSADGRAVLRSSIREFLCSEAMHHLGIPTTRALSLVTTGEAVTRDMFYSGHPQQEPGAIVCRVAPSFIRFGTFELCTARDDRALLAQLVDFTIARDFPHLEGESEAKRAAWFLEVCERTADLVVHWMRVGFVHGVLNTDNMSILGLTIDYGPYGWLDAFDPHWTPNTTDAQHRRYRFSQQPAVAQWNLMRLAEAVSPLFADNAPLQAGIDHFAERYTARAEAMQAAKFGFVQRGTEETAIIREGYQLLYDAAMDYTRFFRALGELPDELPEHPAVVLLGDLFYDEAKRDAHAGALHAWLARWHAAVCAQARPFAERRRAMHQVNPWFVLRNYLAQEAIDLAAAGDPSRVHTLLDALQQPYDEHPAYVAFNARRPDWAENKPGCSMLSCSS
jgi:uncharacterized protein YdiU (UPF0061 family)